MIKTINLQKIFKTEEVETWALNNVSYHGTFRLWKIYSSQYSRFTG